VRQAVHELRAPGHGARHLGKEARRELEEGRLVNDFTSPSSNNTVSEAELCDSPRIKAFSEMERARRDEDDERLLHSD